MITIDKGLPAPAQRGTGVTAALRQMDVGDSMLLSPEHARSIRQLAVNVNVKVSVRGEGDQIRVWRVA